MDIENQTNNSIQVESGQTPSGVNYGRVAIFTILGLVLIVGGYLLISYLDRTPEDVQPEPTPTNTSFNRTVAVIDDSSITLIDSVTGEMTKLIEGVDFGDSFDYSSQMGWEKSVSVSPDNSKIAISIASKIEYYDRVNKKSVLVGEGASPIWSPDSSKMAYVGLESLSIYDVNTGKVSEVNGLDYSSVSITGIALMGWRSNSEVVLYKFGPIDDTEVRFYIADITGLGYRQVIIEGLSKDQSLRDGIVSPDKTKILITFDRDPGYDVGVVDMDGKNFRPISGNDLPRWPGSGFIISGWSPDSKQALVQDMFIPETAAGGYVASGEQQIRDLNGNLKATIVGEKVLPYSRSCWIGNSIYTQFVKDDNNSYVGLYDTQIDTLKEVGYFDYVYDLACPS